MGPVTADGFTRQDRAAAGLGVFRDGVLVATVDRSDQADAAILGLRQANYAAVYEVLKLCPRHPTTSVVDCVVCWPVNT